MGKKHFNYQRSIEEIESIISKIEEGQPDVDELSRMARRAAALIADCRNKLRETGSELDDILEGFDEEE